MEQSRTDRAGTPDSFCSDRWTPSPQRPYSDLQKKKKQAVVRELLNEFDMEETVARYRNQNSQEFVLAESEFSLDVSLSVLRTRQHLQRLMGTDVIRLNDHNYTETLLQKLKEEYEANMDKKEKALADAEKQRLRKLMLEGIISVNVMENPDGKPRRSKRRKYKQKENASKNGPPSIMHEDSPYYQAVAERSESPQQSSDYKQNDVVSQMEIIKNKDSKEKSDENMHEEEDSLTREDSLGHNSRENSAKKQVQWAQPKKQMNSGDESVASPKREYPKGRFSTIDSPLLRDLRHEETVAGLYRLAELLVL
ncbi:uncharacterized protein LOC132551763 [Ylistrum balloti]|uniref:uncharacterized protein LOC132551763 n=1 Tax=Ylistrum balloti TaxID=509963 RepID=UPI002905B346|nr:uncharacterized protein LOC132551763 [Ylistrum balloti]